MARCKNCHGAETVKNVFVSDLAKFTNLHLIFLRPR